MAAKLIKRKQVHNAKLHRREPLLRDLYENTQERLSDDELFEQLAGYSTGATLAQELETNESVATLLTGLSADDQRVLRLAILAGLDGAALARELGIAPVAARVRLHRALSRLRDVQMKRKEQDNDD
jgi:DNA-directed RNA polymerase specialized sigma24 family protein